MSKTAKRQSAPKKSGIRPLSRTAMNSELQELARRARECEKDALALTVLAQAEFNDLPWGVTAVCRALKLAIDHHHQTMCQLAGYAHLVTEAAVRRPA